MTWTKKFYTICLRKMRKGVGGGKNIKKGNKNWSWSNLTLLQSFLKESFWSTFSAKNFNFFLISGGATTIGHKTISSCQYWLMPKWVIATVRLYHYWITTTMTCCHFWVIPPCHCWLMPLLVDATVFWCHCWLMLVLWWHCWVMPPLGNANIVWSHHCLKPPLFDATIVWCHLWVIPCWLMLLLGYASQRLLMPLLTVATDGRCHCWPMPLLANATVGCCHCWLMPLLADATVGWCQCWLMLL